MDMLTLNAKAKRVPVPDRAVTELRQTMRGALIAPGDRAYDEARRVWNGMIDKHPALIAQCEDTADVIAAVRFAREHQIALSVRSGGHNVAGKALCDGGLVIDLSRMRGVHVDPDARTVRVQGGCTLGDIDHETQAFGLAVPFGLVSQTGVAGLTLHGGVGWLTRHYGLALDNLVSMDVVTADGQVRCAGPEEHADLFWALQGGGGNFGIVTSFEFRAYPVGPKVWFAGPIYPLDQAKAVLRSVSRFMEEAPEELGLIATLWSAPEDPRVPKERHGEPIIILLACYHGPYEKGQDVIRPLRDMGTPIADLTEPLRWTRMQSLLDEDYPDGMYYYWKSLYLSRLDDDVFDALIRHASTRPSPQTTLDIWFIGGALNRVGREETAFVRRDARYLLALESNWTDASESEANIAWTRGVFDDMQRFARGTYLNFPGFLEDADKLLAGAYENNYDRLCAIKARYDPDNLFQGALNIVPKR
jgi:hypothetical protein